MVWEEQVRQSALLEWTRRPFEFVKIHHNVNGFYVFALIKKYHSPVFRDAALRIRIYESPFSIFDWNLFSEVELFFLENEIYN